MLKYETPVVFDLVIELSPQNRKRNPDPALIFLVCSASHDPSFRKSKFRTYFDEYVRNGVYCKRGKKLTPARERYYERMRSNKLRHFIRRNWEEIDFQRRAAALSRKE